MQNQIPKDPLINNSNLINIVTNGMNDDKSDSFPVVSQSPVKESARGDGKDGPLITPRAPSGHTSRVPRVFHVRSK